MSTLVLFPDATPPASPTSNASGLISLSAQFTVTLIVGGFPVEILANVWPLINGRPRSVIEVPGATLGAWYWSVTAGRFFEYSRITVHAGLITGIYAFRALNHVNKRAAAAPSPDPDQGITSNVVGGRLSVPYFQAAQLPPDRLDAKARADLALIAQTGDPGISVSLPWPTPPVAPTPPTSGSTPSTVVFLTTVGASSVTLEVR